MPRQDAAVFSSSLPLCFWARKSAAVVLQRAKIWKGVLLALALQGLYKLGLALHALAQANGCTFVASLCHSSPAMQ